MCGPAAGAGGGGKAPGAGRAPPLPVPLAVGGAGGGEGAAWNPRGYAVAEEPLDARASTVVPPYLGLATFQQEDTDRFHGREAAVADLLDRLGRTRFLGVFGPSGCGKSSLLRAGLMPAVPHRTVLLTPTANPPRGLENLVGEDDLLIVDQFEEIFTVCCDAAARDLFISELTGLSARVVIAGRADFLDRCAGYPVLVDALR